MAEQMTGKDESRAATPSVKSSGSEDARIDAKVQTDKPLTIREALIFARNCFASDEYRSKFDAPLAEYAALTSVSEQLQQAMAVALDDCEFWMQMAVRAGADEKPAEHDYLRLSRLRDLTAFPPEGASATDDSKGVSS